MVVAQQAFEALVLRLDDADASVRISTLHQINDYLIGYREIVPMPLDYASVAAALRRAAKLPRDANEHEQITYVLARVDALR